MLSHAKRNDPSPCPRPVCDGAGDRRPEGNRTLSPNGPLSFRTRTAGDRGPSDGKLSLHAAKRGGGFAHT